MELMRTTLVPDPTPAERAVSLCFTGHRPSKLPKGEAIPALIRTLNYYTESAVRKGYRTFYTGMADGVDYWAALKVAELRDAGAPIRLIGVEPFPNYDRYFLRRYRSLEHLETMRNIVDVRLLQDRPLNPNGMLARNIYMVSCSSACIGVCTANGGHSGSAYTLNRAKAQGLDYCWLSSDLWKPPFPAPEDWPGERQGF